MKQRKKDSHLLPSDRRSMMVCGTEGGGVRNSAGSVTLALIAAGSYLMTGTQ